MDLTVLSSLSSSSALLMKHSSLELHGFLRWMEFLFSQNQTVTQNMRHFYCSLKNICSSQYEYVSSEESVGSYSTQSCSNSGAGIALSV